MIQLNPAVPTHVLELERHETFGDYARAYGDEIARAYEHDAAIYFPHFPLPLDLDLIPMLTFPETWKKAGNGITRPLFNRDGGNIVLDDKHPLFVVAKSGEVVAYLLDQMRATQAAIFEGLARLLPRYHSLRLGNITWRCTETPTEAMHVDTFMDGVPLGDQPHRVKLFINIDSLPRQWRISYDLIGILDRYAPRFRADKLVDDFNVVTAEINRANVLAEAPYHTVDFPQLAAVLANGESVAHQVVYGRRVIGVELFVDARDMLDPSLHTKQKLARWLAKSSNPK